MGKGRKLAADLPGWLAIDLDVLQDLPSQLSDRSPSRIGPEAVWAPQRVIRFSRNDASDAVKLTLRARENAFVETAISFEDLHRVVEVDR